MTKKRLMTNKKFGQEVYCIMHSESDPTKFYAMANKAIDCFMQVTGIVAYVWLLVYLLVAIIER